MSLPSVKTADRAVGAACGIAFAASIAAALDFEHLDTAVICLAIVAAYLAVILTLAGVAGFSNIDKENTNE